MLIKIPNDQNEKLDFADLRAKCAFYLQSMRVWEVLSSTIKSGGRKRATCFEGFPSLITFEPWNLETVRMIWVLIRLRNFDIVW
jgi:hypothetical protein